MFGAARQPPSRLRSGGVSLLMAGLFFWKAHDVQASWARMDAYPHEQARVEQTWVTYGKHGGRFADVGFGAGRFLSCRAEGLQVGPSTRSLSVGDYVEIVPRPGSCDTPDVPGVTPAPWFSALLYAVSFIAGLVGLMILTGAWQRAPRSARAF